MSIRYDMDHTGPFYPAINFVRQITTLILEEDRVLGDRIWHEPMAMVAGSTMVADSDSEESEESEVLEEEEEEEESDVSEMSEED